MMQKYFPFCPQKGKLSSIRRSVSLHINTFGTVSISYVMCCAVNTELNGIILYYSLMGNDVGKKNKDQLRNSLKDESTTYMSYFEIR